MRRLHLSFALVTGEIPDLFPDDEVENIIGSLRNEVRGMGLTDTRENCWKFFIDRVRRQLKVREQEWFTNSHSAAFVLPQPLRKITLCTPSVNAFW